MQSTEIRQRFLNFFEARGHAIIPSAPLVPEGDSSTLFTTAGMQPLVPYLLGQKHPKGRRLVNVQKCLRTGDIDEVGDNTHLTFFEMLGNWSLGDYWKQEAIQWSYELLTDKKEGFGLDQSRLYITVFEGNDDPSASLRTGAPKDEESIEVWKKVGIPENRIYLRGADDNWWSPGDNGPCGPSTEMFYDLTEGGLGDMTPEAFVRADDEQKVVEIWNDVFMEYEKRGGKVVGKLKQKNVDTGAGLERVATVLQGKDNVFETDLFAPILEQLPKGDTPSAALRARRIIADHIRAAVFMIAEEIEPSNTDRGYVVRRLTRRLVRYVDMLGMEEGKLAGLVHTISTIYGKNYSNVRANIGIVADVIATEEAAFRKTLVKGKQELKKLLYTKQVLTGEDAFYLYQSFGFPLELTKEITTEEVLDHLNIPPVSNQLVRFKDEKIFFRKMKEHQEKSRTAATGKFKGGLADSGKKTTKLHTAHHLLLAALQKVLGSAVKQRGSNITPERLRIDFSFDRKLTDEEKRAVETQVNEWIAQDLKVVRTEMLREEAEALGAEMEFGAKYPDTVSVYFIQDDEGNTISKEFCGGPHVERTGGLGAFTIKKETSSSAGVRRIKAILQ